MSECAQWRGWMWKRLIVAHVFMCVLHQPSVISDIGGLVEVDEQRVCIKFCLRLGKTGSETFEILKQAFGDSCMSRSELLSGLDVSRMSELRLLMMIDQVGQARQQPPQKRNR